jgi:hypothetical protein
MYKKKFRLHQLKEQQKKIPVKLSVTNELFDFLAKAEQAMKDVRRSHSWSEIHEVDDDIGDANDEEENKKNAEKTRDKIFKNFVQYVENAKKDKAKNEIVQAWIRARREDQYRLRQVQGAHDKFFEMYNKMKRKLARKFNPRTSMSRALNEPLCW